MCGQSAFIPSGKKNTICSYRHKYDSYVSKETENSMLEEECLGSDYNSLEVIVFIFTFVNEDLLIMTLIPSALISINIFLYLNLIYLFI
jgi:hypothetical protein